MIISCELANEIGACFCTICVTEKKSKSQSTTYKDNNSIENREDLDHLTSGYCNDVTRHVLPNQVFKQFHEICHNPGLLSAFEKWYSHGTP